MDVAFVGFGLFGLFFVGVVVLMVVLVVVGLRKARLNTAEIAAWAVSRGWHHTAEDPYVANRWAGEPFDRGHRRRGIDVVRGVVDGYRIVSFTYRWTVRSSDGDSTTHAAHVVALDVQPSLPTLELTPEGLSARVARWFGGQDVEIGWPPFDDAWRVRTSDEAFARSVLDPRVAQRLLQQDVLGLCVRVEGPSVLTWTSGSTQPEHLDARVHQLADLARAFGKVPDAVDDAPRPPDAGYGAPGYGTSGFGTSGYSNPGFGTPGQDFPDYGTPSD